MRVDELTNNTTGRAVVKLRLVLLERLVERRDVLLCHDGVEVSCVWLRQSRYLLLSERARPLPASSSFTPELSPPITPRAHPRGLRIESDTLFASYEPNRGAVHIR